MYSSPALLLGIKDLTNILVKTLYFSQGELLIRIIAPKYYCEWSIPGFDSHA